MIHKRSTALERSVANLTLHSDVGQDKPDNIPSNLCTKHITTILLGLCEQVKRLLKIYISLNVSINNKNTYMFIWERPFDSYGGEILVRTSISKEPIATCDFPGTPCPRPHGSARVFPGHTQPTVNKSQQMRTLFFLLSRQC